MADLEAIAAAVAGRAGALPGISSSRDHEPERLPKLPASTLLFQRAELVSQATGGLEEWAYEWRLGLYVSLEGGYQAAQVKLYELVPGLLAVLRDDPKLGGLVAWSELRDDGAEPLFNHEERWLLKRLTLRASAEET